MSLRQKCAVVLLCWIALPMSAVPAYVLPAPHVLDLMVRKLGAAKGLAVSQKNFFFDALQATRQCSENDPDCSDQPPAAADDSPAEASTTMPVEIRETLRYAFPYGFRADVHTASGERVHIFVGGRRLTVIDGAVAVEPLSPLDAYPHLLLYRSRNALTARLDEYGVNTGICSLGRFDGRVAFVIGAVYPDASVPQVWIDKETLMPIRWIVSGSDPGEQTTRFEIRYIEWRRQKDIWYPDQIEFFQGGSPVRLIQAEQFALNPAFSHDLFDIDALLARSRPAAPSAGSGQPRKGLSELQKTIQEFKRLFE